MKLLNELYAYREMIYMLVRRELRGRYKGSALGFFWTFLNPLLQFAVYAVVFSVLMKMNIDKFYVYLFVAFIPWFFTATAIPQGATCIQAQSNLVQKIYFPRMVLPLATVLTAFVNMLLSEIVVFIVLLMSGFYWSVYMLVLPVVMGIHFLLVLGIDFDCVGSNCLSACLAHILDIVIMAWFYATPIVYPPEMIPEKFQFLLYLNPMSGIIDGYRKILYYRCMPDFSTMLLALVVGIITVVVGTFVFQRLQRGFAEEL